MIPGLDIIFGGITGLIGNAFTTFFKFKNAKLKYEHDEKMVEIETQAMILESEAQIKITKSRIEGEVELANAEAFDTSQKHGAKQMFSEKWIDLIMAAGEGKWFGWFFKTFGMLIASGFAFVDWLNGFMRPALTMYLVGASSYITYLAWLIIESKGLDTLTSDQAVDIFTQVTSTVIYLAVSSVTWWFGDRTMSKFLQDQGKK